MEKTNKYYSIIENLVKQHKKFPGNETILDDIIDDVYSHSEVIINSISNESVIKAYLEKVISTSIITVPKKLNIHKEKPSKTLQNAISEGRTVNTELIDKMINSSYEQVKQPETEYKKQPPADTNELSTTEPLEEELVMPENLEENDINTISVDEMIEFSDTAPINQSEILDIDDNTDFNKELEDSSKNVLDEEIEEDKNDFLVDTKEEEDIHFQIENDNNLEEDESANILEFVQEKDASDIIETDSTELPIDHTENVEMQSDDILNLDLVEPEDTIIDTVEENLVSDSNENNQLDSEILEISNPDESDEELEITDSVVEHDDIDIHETEPATEELSFNELDENTDINNLLEESDIIETQEPLIDNDDNNNNNATNGNVLDQISLNEENDEDITNLTETESPLSELPETLDNEETNTSDTLEEPLEFSDAVAGDELVLEESNMDYNLTEDVGNIDSLEEFSDTSLELEENPTLSIDTDLEINDINETTGEELLSEENDKTPINDTAVNYSVFNYIPDKNTEDIDIDVIIKDLSELDRKRPELNIVKVYELKYKDNLSVSEIALQLEMSENNVIEALSEIIAVV